METNQPTVFWNLLEAAPIRGGLKNLDMLSESERRRAEGFRFDKRREEWLIGREAAKKLLIGSDERFKGVNLVDLSIENEPEGAPYFMFNGQPINCSLSISHRDRLAFCSLIAGNVGSIGADIEKIEPRLPVFSEDYFTSSEQFIIKENRWMGLDLPVTLIWSAKEAVLKALRKGLRLDTRDVEVSRIEERVSEWGSFTAHSQYFNGQMCLGWWRKHSGYVLTLALLKKSRTPAPDQTIQLVQVF